VSNLYPGGQRILAGRRIFGFENIRRAILAAVRDYGRGAETSIAKANRHTGKPHEHKREIARRKQRRQP
jgi:hypothetical protein